VSSDEQEEMENGEKKRGWEDQKAIGMKGC
jgi:hypothetical protein